MLETLDLSVAMSRDQYATELARRQQANKPPTHGGDTSFVAVAEWPQPGMAGSLHLRAIHRSTQAWPRGAGKTASRSIASWG